MTQYVLRIEPTGKRTLYGFASHVPNGVPAEELQTIDIPTDKTGLQNAFQELLDQIGPVGPVEDDNALSGDPEQPEAQSGPTDGIAFLCFPEDREMTAKEMLKLRTAVEENWQFFPRAFKCDLMCALMETLRSEKQEEIK